MTSSPRNSRVRQSRSFHWGGGAHAADEEPSAHLARLTFSVRGPNNPTDRRGNGGVYQVPPCEFHERHLPGGLPSGSGGYLPHHRVAMVVSSPFPPFGEGLQHPENFDIESGSRLQTRFCDSTSGSALSSDVVAPGSSVPAASVIIKGDHPPADESIVEVAIQRQNESRSAVRTTLKSATEAASIPAKLVDRASKPSNCPSWRDFVIGTAPALSNVLEGRPLLDFMNCALRGVGQVMFMNNPITGALILMALFWQSLYVASFGTVGVVSATLAAFVLGLDPGSRRSGLLGFNGLLVGLALATFDRGCVDAADCQLGLWQSHSGWLLIPVVIFSVVSVIFSVSLGNLLAPVWGVVAFTLPFNFAAFMFLGTSLQSGSFPQPFSQALLPSSSISAGSNSSTVPGGETIDWLQVLEAIPKGIGQVYLADNTISGCVIALSLAICSPLSALMAVLGSLIGTAVAVCMHVPLTGVYVGLWGYNAVLGMQAIGGMFFYPTVKAIVMAAVCAVMCAYMGGLISSMFSPLGLPALTLPFCLATLSVVMLQDTVPGFNPVPLNTITVPEDHYRKLRTPDESHTNVNDLTHLTFSKHGSMVHL